jgi:hypothetical protein
LGFGVEAHFILVLLKMSGKLSNEGTKLTFSVAGLAAGKVSTGLMHATPGEIKSLRSSALRMALIVMDAHAGSAAES